MKLYFSKGACSLAVRIIINEIGLSCKYESVNLRTKQTVNDKNFIDINPKGYVPVLELEEGKVLTENIVIQQYLAEKHKASGLLPAVDNIDRYKVLEWLNFITTELHKSCSALFNPTISEELKESTFKPLLRKKLDFVNEHLSNSKYLLKEQFTLPDGYLFVVLLWLNYFQINVSDWQHLNRFQTELNKRPSIKQSLQEEGI